MTHWETVRRQANKNLQQQSVWTSFVWEHRYRVHSVTRSKIELTLLNGGKKAILTPGMVESAMCRLLESRGLSHKKFINSVAKASAMVQFHPNVFWEQDSRLITWKTSTVENPTDSGNLDELPEDELEKLRVEVNRRKYQGRFRRKLLKAFGNKCTVSGVADVHVLEAAHIVAHASSRINKTTNGLLLRADLHLLFDKNLLKVHPHHLTVHISNSILENEYTKFDGIKIRTRIDGKVPDKELLELKWNLPEDR